MTKFIDDGQLYVENGLTTDSSWPVMLYPLLCA